MAIAIIQARMSSSRLQGKVLKPLAGKPMIWHIVQRARSCQQVDEVVVATSIEPSDDLLATFCKDSNITCHRGSLQNVLNRYIKILNSDPHDHFVRITGDCPLIDPEFIDKQIIAIQEHDADFVWLDTPVSVLEGQSVHSTRSLKLIAAKSQHPDDLEHVGSRYLSEHPEKFRIIGMHPPESLSNLNWRITIDEAEDYEMMENLYADLYQSKPVSLQAALTWMEQNPDLSAKNKSVEHSIINQKLAKKRKAWKKYVDFYCDWYNPQMNVEQS